VKRGGATNHGEEEGERRGREESESSPASVEQRFFDELT